MRSGESGGGDIASDVQATGDPTQATGRAHRASATSCYALRLHPGQELKSGLMAATSEFGVKAGFIMTCVGSVRDVVLRLAGADRPDRNDSARRPRSDTGVQHTGRASNHLRATPNACFEVLSLVGTLSPDGVHLHISLGDDSGAVIGGHLVSAQVHTTAEVVIGEATSLSFTRVVDEGTGFQELVVGGQG